MGLVLRRDPCTPLWRRHAGKGQSGWVWFSSEALALGSAYSATSPLLWTGQHVSDRWFFPTLPPLRVRVRVRASEQASKQNIYSVTIPVGGVLSPSPSSVSPSPDRRHFNLDALMLDAYSSFALINSGIQFLCLYRSLRSPELREVTVLHRE